MSITGNLGSKEVLRGRINRLDTLCMSAYAIAVKNGFSGTEEEWLASLKGEPGDPAPKELVEAAVEESLKNNPPECTPTDEQVVEAINEYLKENPVQGGSVYIGAVKPASGVLYWLDTTDSGGVAEEYTVTTELTNVVIDNKETTVAEGESYATSISVSDGYVLSSVTVTMGGKDITGSNYADGNIYIPFVDGNIVVTASARAITEEEKVYTIANNLVNVTSNNSAVSASGNSTYNATLTADDGYALDAVTVTMGGVDVTADVYADGVITISAVTGNVVITAVAAEELNVVELKPDYMTFTYYRVTMADTAPTNLAEDMPETLNLVAKINTQNSYGGSCTLSVRDTGWTATKTNIDYTRQIITVDENLYAVVTFTKEAYMTAYEEWLANIDSGLIAYGGTFQLGGASNNFYSSYLVRAIAGTIDENVIRHLERTWEEVTA